MDEQDYWRIALYPYGIKVVADTMGSFDDKHVPHWNRFPSRKEAERAMDRVVELLEQIEKE